MQRYREIVFDELKNGTLVCRDGRNGSEFGRASSFDDAMNVALEWLYLKQYEGEVAVLVRPWRAIPFSGPMLHHNYNNGKNLWKT